MARARDQDIQLTQAVKVSYTVEGSGSYCTVLNGRHNVYVHPAVAYNAARSGQASSGRGKNGTPARNGGAGGGGHRGEAVMGSCCLRDVAWGVCDARWVPLQRVCRFYCVMPSDLIRYLTVREGAMGDPLTA